MTRAPTDRAAVPEASSRRGPIPTSVTLALLCMLSMAWIPATESLANAYRAHTEELIKSRSCEDTTKPVTRRAIK